MRQAGCGPARGEPDLECPLAPWNNRSHDTWDYIQMAPDRIK